MRNMTDPFSLWYVFNVLGVKGPVSSKYRHLVVKLVLAIRGKLHIKENLGIFTSPAYFSEKVLADS